MGQTSGLGLKYNLFGKLRTECSKARFQWTRRLFPQDTRVSVLEEEQNDGAWALPSVHLCTAVLGPLVILIPSAVKLFYWEERLGLTPLWQQWESSHSLDWSVASAKCLVTDPDAEEALVKFCPCWSEQLWCEWARAFLPLFLSGPQDRYHRGCLVGGIISSSPGDSRGRAPDRQ